MNITEREKVYFKILIQLNDEIKNIITLLNKIEKHGVTSEANNIISIYDRFFLNKELEDHIKYEIDYVGSSTSFRYLTQPNSEHGSKHLTLLLNSEEINWIDSLYDKKISEIIEFFRYLFSVIENYSIYKDKSRLSMFLQVAAEINKEVESFLAIIKQDEKDIPEDYKKLKTIENQEKKLKSKGIPFKPDKQDYIDIIKKQNIKYLYHFTDINNLISIKESGGLYSWGYLEKAGKGVKKYASNRISRLLDERKGAENYVRLSFTENHPMNTSKADKSHIKPVVFKINPELIYHIGTKYCDRNAIMAGAKISDSFEYFKSIRFDLFNKKYDNLNADEKMYYSAEILIYEHVPIKYILNFDEVFEKNKK
jgi:hypothetical protein